MTIELAHCATRTGLRETKGLDRDVYYNLLNYKAVERLRSELNWFRL